jgi:hypothetical protein
MEARSLDYSATDRYCAEELLILLINFMKIYRTDFQNQPKGKRDMGLPKKRWN